MEATSRLHGSNWLVARKQLVGCMEAIPLYLIPGVSRNQNIGEQI